MHWLWFHAGLSNGNYSWYLFPSGWGSILIPPVITVAGIWVMFWWRTSCQHSRWCVRHGRHDWTDPETKAVHKLCWKHAGARKHVGARLRELQQKTGAYLGDKPGKG